LSHVDQPLQATKDTHIIIIMTETTTTGSPSNGGANGGSNGGTNGGGALVGTGRVKQGLAQMLKGGVIVSLLNYSQSARGAYLGWFLVPLGPVSCIERRGT